jgi:hypothetical protein
MNAIEQVPGLAETDAEMEARKQAGIAAAAAAQADVQRPLEVEELNSGVSKVVSNSKPTPPSATAATPLLSPDSKSRTPAVFAKIRGGRHLTPKRRRSAKSKGRSSRKKLSKKKTGSRK